MSTNRFLSLMAYFDKNLDINNVNPGMNSVVDKTVDNGTWSELTVLPIQDKVMGSNEDANSKQPKIISSLVATTILYNESFSLSCGRCSADFEFTNQQSFIDQACLDEIEQYLNDHNDSTISNISSLWKDEECGLYYNIMINNEATSLLNISIDETELNDTRQQCPIPSPLLSIGELDQSKLTFEYDKSFQELTKQFANLGPGGVWQPSNCESREKIAIIIPFRDRQAHLKRLLEYLIPMLKRQYLNFRFVVTEQCGNDLFNKGRIMNAAAKFAIEILGIHCLIFHDVDLFPQNDGNYYGCSYTKNAARHIGGYVNSLNYE
uniref:Beta-1,4-N-acetylgalactosaminyltransferase n=1 Tax=Romanomermis culicivorax TaxID=13658 RepID=A0A915L353_ROMCU